MRTHETSARRLGGSAAREDSILAIEVSASQDSTDLAPTRLDASKAAAVRNIEVKAAQHPEDRVGILSFCDFACVEHQLAVVGRDYAPLVRTVKGLRAGGGTNIVAGLERAEQLLVGSGPRTIFDAALRIFGWERDPRSAGPATQRIVLLSDGDHNGAGDPVSVAQRLHQRGVVIDVIGVAGGHGEPLFDEEQLRAIASPDGRGGRRYYFIRDAASLIKRFEQLGHHLKPLEAEA